MGRPADDVQRLKVVVKRFAVESRVDGAKKLRFDGGAAI
jgi:hypothetical protein